MIAHHLGRLCLPIEIRPQICAALPPAPGVGSAGFLFSVQGRRATRALAAQLFSLLEQGQGFTLFQLAADRQSFGNSLDQRSPAN
jgi:hypothetical protein